jgi:hypothetical protein
MAWRFKKKNLLMTTRNNEPFCHTSASNVMSTGFKTMEKYNLGYISKTIARLMPLAGLNGAGHRKLYILYSIKYQD